MDINALVPHGYKIVNTQKGDLNGDGVLDALLLVEESGKGTDVLSEGAKRKVMVLIGDRQDKYTIAVVNDKIVPCATCGGISGDPFSYMQVDKDGMGFSVVTEGGSREHWANEYHFRYDSVARDWILDALNRSVADKETEKSKEIKLKEADLQAPKFGDVDPASYPQVKLP